MQGPDTIPAAVRTAAERFGERTAIEDGAVRLSFAELDAARLRAARAFCAAGLESGDRVAIWAPNLAEWIVAAIGLQSAGGVLVPLNTRMKGGEAAYVLRKTRARMLCTVGEFLGNRYVAALRDEELPDLAQTLVLQGSEPGATSWDAFLAEGESFPEHEAQRRSAAVGPLDLSDLIFTSGTTGQPKGVMTSHGQNLRAFKTWSQVVGLRADDRYLMVNVFSHSFGYKAGWLASILSGATMLPQAVFEVPEVLERIGRDRISVLPGPPTLYQSILAHPEREKYDLSSLRLAVTGAAAIPVELIHRMRDELGFETVLTAYGLTETCGLVSMCRIGDDPETIATTSGRAIPDIELRCVDVDGNEVATDATGEVVVRGYNVMSGYFDDPEETSNAIDADGWLHTGDLAVLDARGNLRITGRIKDMFIVGGFNCYPAEIENMMFSSGLFAQVAVIGVPDERMGEVGMAFVIPARGAAADTELSAESITEWCREHMANYKVPRRIEIVDALPTNATGKVEKTLLLERALQNP